MKKIICLAKLQHFLTRKFAVQIADTICSPLCSFKIAFIRCYHLTNWHLTVLTYEAYRCCLTSTHPPSLKFLWLSVNCSAGFAEYMIRWPVDLDLWPFDYPSAEHVLPRWCKIITNLSRDSSLMTQIVPRLYYEARRPWPFVTIWPQNGTASCACYGSTVHQIWTFTPFHYWVISHDGTHRPTAISWPYNFDLWPFTSECLSLMVIPSVNFV